MIDLPTDTAHHVKVRRLRTGARVVLFDGQGSEGVAVLRLDNRAELRAEIESVTAKSRERFGHITLVQGLASQERMDWAVEKAVEAGVHRLIPVQAARSVSRLSEARSVKRAEHWRRLVQSASEQCGRNHLMDVSTVTSLPAALLATAQTTRLLCALRPDGVPINAEPVLEAVRLANAVTLLVGPEGGWDAQEMALAQAQGAIPVSLGERVYRTETAGLVGVTTLATWLNW